MVNNSCLSSCAFSHYHMNTLAHASQSNHPSRGFFIDWCFLRCTMMKLRNPVDYIRSEWIRPEDLHLYEGFGYERFKVTERGAPTDVLVARVKAYTERRYDGNLLDLAQPYGFSKAVAAKESSRGAWWRLRRMLRPFLVDLRRLWNLKKLTEELGMLQHHDGPPPVYIDNRKLDGFMDRLANKGCKDVDCEACRYCHQWAERSVAIDEQYRDAARSYTNRCSMTCIAGGCGAWTGPGAIGRLRLRRNITPELSARAVGNAGPAAPRLAGHEQHVCQCVR